VSDWKVFGDVGVAIGDDFVATAEIRRPPHNYFNLSLIEDLASAFEELDAEPRCRTVVLCSAGKNFCAGAQLGGPRPSLEQAAIVGEAAGPDAPPRHLYDEAVRLFRTRTPVVAAIQGAAQIKYRRYSDDCFKATDDRGHAAVWAG